MGKGKKKKRKNFATDSYLDLSLQDVNDKEDQQCKEEETQHILSALDCKFLISVNCYFNLKLLNLLKFGIYF